MLVVVANSDDYGMNEALLAGLEYNLDIYCITTVEFPQYVAGWGDIDLWRD